MRTTWDGNRDSGGVSDDLIGSQRTYYDERAEHYMDLSKPSDRIGRGYMSDEMTRSLIDEFAPTGDVLELACGPGTFTRDIALHASSLTVVDGSPRMLDRARAAVGDANVTFIEADLFTWEPARTYDAVFFGCWLSHVPPDRFEDFWTLVRRCLRPGDRVGFVDEDDRGAVNDEVSIVDGVPTALRTLADGRTFDIVKVFWRPDDLERALRASGWDVAVRRVGDAFLYGEGRPV